MASHATTAHPDLTHLKERLSEINGLNAAISLMYWDQATYLPEQGARFRGEHISHIVKVAHELATSPELGRLLDSAEKIAQGLPPDSVEAALVRVARKDYAQAVRIPSSLSAELSAQASRSYEAWKKARAADNFDLVADELKRNIDLSRKKAEHLQEPQHGSIMDPLIDLSDSGFTVATLRPMFESLRARLVPLLDRVTAEPAFDHSSLRQAFPEDAQLAFGEHLIRSLGYDFERGRQDKTHHPFMIRLAHGDVRITTRVKEFDLSEALFSTVHEAGHALYELGIDESLEGGPLASGATSGIHESQSRFWENIVGRGLPFWQHFYPELQRRFPQQLGRVTVEEFHRAINRVERSLIRTDADELTYNLHVMIRFDLELALLEGQLEVERLPEAWNERYRTDLGAVPTNLSEGALQDVHWFHGTVGGAFQGYTIGNVLSGQLYAAARRAIPDFDDRVRSGEFGVIREWLRDNLHRFGRMQEGPDLIRHATGRDLGVEDYLSYLEAKYQALLQK